jgi:hypothetical protein
MTWARELEASHLTRYVLVDIDIYEQPYIVARMKDMLDHDIILENKDQVLVC